MPLELHPAVDADMHRAAAIEREAYSPLASNAVLFPGPLPPGALKYRAEGLKKKAARQGVYSFKVVDTALEGDEQMIAFAQWYKEDSPTLSLSDHPYKKIFLMVYACTGLFTTPVIRLSLRRLGPSHRTSIQRRASSCSTASMSWSPSIWATGPTFVSAGKERRVGVDKNRDLASRLTTQG